MDRNGGRQEHRHQGLALKGFKQPIIFCDLPQPSMHMTEVE